MEDLTATEVYDWAYESARLDLMSRLPAVPTHRPVLFEECPSAASLKAADKEAKKIEKALAASAKKVASDEKKRNTALSKIAKKAAVEEKKRMVAWMKANKVK
jgi:DNA-binding transcriptional regulator/RsmH inhibitor MraZ